ncbi:arginine--tRNA ligase [Oceanirhabdus sp. W0125-5]|uniref:arginine--tRNA ligase n=1 Tax=Oceanirhabdus sp. W0125-5 TaxID=2999116 RepID=UPI0022F2C1AA|nr:arginine--tRNA ligase [Oceanirhabdus sp. W0125-5]WBW99806.1 arginine--tRNA ligase [Oceanirhabdus sp. W0125-5]
MNYKSKIAEVICQIDNSLEINFIEEIIEVPPNSEMGDYSLPCFKLAKHMKKPPVLIAKEIKESLEEKEVSDLFSDIKSQGPYLNFFKNYENNSKIVISNILKSGDKYGADTIGEGNTVCVEFSSVNIAKPFHVGHVKGTVIGNVLANIHEFLGYKVERINHLGDYGTQYGNQLCAYKKWGNKERVEKNPIRELVELYVKFHNEAEKDLALFDEGRAWFKKIEEGNEEALNLWNWTKDVSMIEFKRIYDMLGIEYDSYAGESFYTDKMPAIVEKLEKEGLLVESQGAKVVELDQYDLTSAIIKKSDGTTIYMTRDLAAAKYRKDTYDFYKSIYIVAYQQDLHFKQLFKILELMGYEWAKDCIHVGHGMINLGEGTLSTRKGCSVWLEDVLNKAVDKALEIIEEKNPTLNNKEEAAKKIGVGAIVYEQIANKIIKDHTFKWEEALSFTGETAPYIQYAYVRGNKVLNKIGELDLLSTEGTFIHEKIDYSVLSDNESKKLISILEGFQQVVKESCIDNEPSYLARYTVKLAQAFNKFYNANRVINEEETIKITRGIVIKATLQVISNACSLMGIELLDEM